MTDDEALAKLLGRKVSPEEREAIESGALRFNIMRLGFSHDDAELIAKTINILPRLLASLKQARGEGELVDTFEKMLGERLTRRNEYDRTSGEEMRKALNEGWIDALEHIIGMMRLRSLKGQDE